MRTVPPVLLEKTLLLVVAPRVINLSVFKHLFETRPLNPQKFGLTAEVRRCLLKLATAIVLKKFALTPTTTELFLGRFVIPPTLPPLMTEVAPALALRTILTHEEHPRTRFVERSVKRAVMALPRTATPFPKFTGLTCP